MAVTCTRQSPCTTRTISMTSRSRIQLFWIRVKNVKTLFNKQIAKATSLLQCCGVDWCSGRHRYLGLLFRPFSKAHTCTFFSKLTVIVFVIFLSFSAIACRDLAKLE